MKYKIVYHVEPASKPTDYEEADYNTLEEVLEFINSREPDDFSDLIVYQEDGLEIWIEKYGKAKRYIQEQLEPLFEKESD